jgi:hypothetical protein
MTNGWPSTFKQWLIEHGVRLRPPADEASLRELLAILGGTVHPDLINLYEAFDGCDQGDFEVNSFVSFWPIREGIAFARERGFRNEFPIADVSISADIAVCSAPMPGAPVKWLWGMYEPSSSLSEFCQKLMTGRF